MLAGRPAVAFALSLGHFFVFFIVSANKSFTQSVKEAVFKGNRWCFIKLDNMYVSH